MVKVPPKLACSTGSTSSSSSNEATFTSQTLQQTPLQSILHSTRLDSISRDTLITHKQTDSPPAPLDADADAHAAGPARPTSPLTHSSPNSMSSLLFPNSPLYGSLFYTHLSPLSSLLLPPVYLQSLHSFPHSLLLSILSTLSTCFPLHSLLSSKHPFFLRPSTSNLPPSFSASRMPSTPIAKWRSCVASDTRGAAAQLEAFACCCLCSHVARDGSVTGLTTCQAAQKATTTYFW